MYQCNCWNQEFSKKLQMKSRDLTLFIYLSYDQVPQDLRNQNTPSYSQVQPSLMIADMALFVCHVNTWYGQSEI